MESEEGRTSNQNKDRNYFRKFEVIIPILQIIHECKNEKHVSRDYTNIWVSFTNFKVPKTKVKCSVNFFIMFSICGNFLMKNNLKM